MGSLVCFCFGCVCVPEAKQLQRLEVCSAHGYGALRARLRSHEVRPCCVMEWRVLSWWGHLGDERIVRKPEGLGRRADVTSLSWSKKYEAQLDAVCAEPQPLRADTCDPSPHLLLWYLRLIGGDPTSHPMMLPLQEECFAPSSHHAVTVTTT